MIQNFQFKNNEFFNVSKFKTANDLIIEVMNVMDFIQILRI
jgi:hypothetical protein